MDFPVEHLSASSVNMFLRCPRQWQLKYVHKVEGPTTEPLLMGSAVHLALSRVLKGEDAGDFWGDALLAAETTVEFKDESAARAQAEAWIYHYYEQIGKYLNVIDTELEIQLEVPGVPIPVLGYVDIVTPERIIDLKTTGYLSRNVRLNKEWRLQAHIYQLAHAVPAEFHVLTRAKSDPLVVPSSKDDKLYVSVAPTVMTVQTIRFVYNAIEDCLNRYGEDFPWPGNPTHEWADRYCAVENCCQRF